MIFDELIIRMILRLYDPKIKEIVDSAITEGSISNMFDLTYGADFTDQESKDLERFSMTFIENAILGAFREDARARAINVCVVQNLYLPSHRAFVSYSVRGLVMTNISLT